MGVRAQDAGGSVTIDDADHAGAICSLEGVVDGIVDAHMHEWDPFQTPREASGLAKMYRLAPGFVEKHFRRLAGQPNQELLLTPKNAALPYLPDQYTADAEGVAEAVGAPIRSVVHCEAGWAAKGALAAADETRWLMSLPFGKDGRPSLAAIIARADPRDPECRTLLDTHLEVSTKVKCIRQLAAWHPDPKVKSLCDMPGLLASRDFLAGFPAVAERGLSFEATVNSNQLADVPILAREFPQTTIVVSHLATPIGLFGPMGSRTGWTMAQRAGIAGEWRDGISAVAEYPNVVAKSSGFAFPQLGYGHEPEGNIGRYEVLRDLWRPLMDHVIDAFGVDRLMFGSNFPMDRPNTTVPTVAGMLVDLLGPRGDDALRKVFRDNAQRIYELDN
ncbi:amidohydrolase family protein [Nocardia ninae]|uniref:Amidohydrolase-related domain-containing protein n=1 Tax=Nocardia ninae NBRC 108245 TaxID=1210091 RepID=A0A511MEB2_9NOCA|nr:amidohydrolase family protein [Nocardia ninae]GEM38821.1 hypothetical protein NN4_33400 [Nocardia ninae NBRC 108245]